MVQTPKAMGSGLKETWPSPLVVCVRVEAAPGAMAMTLTPFSSAPLSETFTTMAPVKGSGVAVGTSNPLGA